MPVRKSPVVLTQAQPETLLLSEAYRIHDMVNAMNLNTNKNKLLLLIIYFRNRKEVRRSPGACTGDRKKVTVFHRSREQSTHASASCSRLSKRNDICCATNDIRSETTPVAPRSRSVTKNWCNSILNNGLDVITASTNDFTNR